MPEKSQSELDFHHFLKQPKHVWLEKLSRDIQKI